MGAPFLAFSSKAENYARYRWDYASQAVRSIYGLAGLSSESLLADIGAGTGILTRHFSGKLSHVFAIEPNLEMRRLAARKLNAIPGCSVVAACAEAVPLPAHSLDILTVAQAIHWFNPEPARQEFLRLLKPGGWLAILRNYGTDQALNSAMEAFSTPENGVRPAPSFPFDRQPVSFYFPGGKFQQLTFPFANRENWTTFFGALLSTSFMPDEGDPGYAKLEKAAREVFARFSREGWIDIQGETELVIGQP